MIGSAARAPMRPLRPLGDCVAGVAGGLLDPSSPESECDSGNSVASKLSSSSMLSFFF